MLGELALKARMTTEKLNNIAGIRCNEVMGAMYAFPRIFLPEKAVAEAKVHFTKNSYLYIRSSATAEIARDAEDVDFSVGDVDCALTLAFNSFNNIIVL